MTDHKKTYTFIEALLLAKETPGREFVEKGSDDNTFMFNITGDLTFADSYSSFIVQVDDFDAEFVEVVK